MEGQSPVDSFPPPGQSRTQTGAEPKPSPTNFLPLWADVSRCWAAWQRRCKTQCCISGLPRAANNLVYLHKTLEPVEYVPVGGLLGMGKIGLCPGGGGHGCCRKEGSGKWISMTRPMLGSK